MPGQPAACEDAIGGERGTPVGDAVAGVGERPLLGQRAALAFVTADRAEPLVAETEPPPLGSRLRGVAAKLGPDPLTLEHGQDQLRQAAGDDHGAMPLDQLAEARPHLDVLDRPGRHLVRARADRGDLGRERLAVAREALRSNTIGVAEAS